MRISLILGCGIAIMTSLPATAIEVVVSVKPLHSLVSAVMQGSPSVPSLLVEGANSPHGFALRPSHVEALSRADLHPPGSMGWRPPFEWEERNRSTSTTDVGCTCEHGPLRPGLQWSWFRM